MRRIPLILGLVLITTVMVHDVYEFLVTNEGIRYFYSDPRRLLYVILLGVAGGIAALGISRLSPGSQRTLKLTALGTFGTVLLGFLGVFTYFAARSASTMSEAGMWGWIAAACLSFAVIAILVWLEFRQVWRTT